MLLLGEKSSWFASSIRASLNLLPFVRVARTVVEWFPQAKISSIYCP
ncbi:hypothetical protein QQP08_017882 [Theobroma cacao]|nr:hypothetical protein QQP08_017882 [Theobroma cacao]